MTVLAFLERSTPIDYGRRFSRLRWKQAVPAAQALSLRPEDSAEDRICGEEVWVLVADDAALPVREFGAALEPGRILAAGRAPVPPVHTLRELEAAGVCAAVSAVSSADSAPSALCFRPAENPPAAGERVAEYVERLRSSRRLDHLAEFAVLKFEDPSERERPELTRHLPAEVRRLLDVGCGAGGTAAAVKSRAPSLCAVGIEKDPAAAASARLVLDRVLEDDAASALEGLAGAGETFDAFLFGDVLEHLVDPVAALTLARRLALPGATLVASVPNVGHLSIVRDLALGRFDPAPAGLEDAGHLRWFDRRFFAEALEESGWRVRSIEAEPGAPAPDAEAFLASLASWPGLDRESLRTYQWIAVAHPAPPIGPSGEVRSGD